MKKIVLLLVILALPLLASVVLYRMPSVVKPTALVIPPGSGVRAVLAQLSEAEVIPSKGIMLAPLLLSGDYKNLKAGEYEFAAGATPAQVIAKLVRGEVVIHKLTIPEGWTSYQIRAALMAEPLLTGELPEVAEGSLLPDTYHFSRGERRQSVLNRMQRAHADLLQALWPMRAVAVPLETPQEALILASVIERETGVAGERHLVSGVFINRLRLGMKLQSDPTVAYGIEQQQGGAPMSRALTRADLQADTPYNTYTRAGLPPGPICHPGRAAIEAALNPAVTPALYFVATGTGGHSFAETLAEHNHNTARYREQLRAAEVQTGHAQEK